MEIRTLSTLLNISNAQDITQVRDSAQNNIHICCV
jgi:hypothetical protein